MSEEKETKGTLKGLLLGRKNLHPTRIVVVGFLLVILLGAFLLTLPIASRDGTWTHPLTCLFTATSATCVTGLVVVDPWIHWSLFGQIVILCLIQIGGLGFISVFSLVSFAFHRRISLSERMVMGSNFNLNGLNGVVRLVRHAVYGTLLLEGTGAVLLASQFIPEYGILGGIWRGIFHAISAFCNAGFDILGDHGAFLNLIPYAGNPVICLTIATLIVVGGLGFFVWEDVLQHKKWSKLSLYSKLVLLCTGTLIVVGFCYFLAAEWNNPNTLGALPAAQRPLAALFQSVTLRTAGFATIDQGALYDTSKGVSIVFMLIGGSSGSTAGGIKTVTVFTVLMAVRAGLTGREEITVRDRAVSHRQAFNAMVLAFFVTLLLMGGTFIIALADRTALLDTAFEVASALGTVGLTTGITPDLSAISRWVLIACMYLGRVGVLSFSVALIAKKKSVVQEQVKHPVVNFMIG